MTIIEWEKLPHRARSLIAADCEPNFTRSVLDNMVMTLGEEQILAIENSIYRADEETVKDILYHQFLDCLFDSVN